MTPPSRPLVEILVDVVEHGKDQPTHGIDCSCMGKLIREIRGQVNSVLPSSHEEPDWEPRLNARRRVSYVMHSAVRYL
jgi:hypothetical protein